MKRGMLVLLAILFVIIIGINRDSYSDDIKKEDCYFLSSLHYTTRGMGYWYDKENGGIETLTGIPYSKLTCKNCHTASCDVCHKTESDKKLSYSTEVAQSMEICLRCHKRARVIRKIDTEKNQQDVHFGKGMQCMDCHNAREVHGDGNEYTSMKQPGALDAQCEDCHKAVNPTASHKVHREKLDCNACHIRHVVTCYNCHFETLVKEGKRVSIHLSDWTFLMNYNGKVTSSNMQSFVVGDNKTFLMFAPQNSHSVMKDGRKCGDCHATENVKQAQEGKLRLTWLENKELKHMKGTIPVVEGVVYDCVYYNYQNDQWVPIESPSTPLLHYAGYGVPLSNEQLKKMAMPMGRE